jgi:hypothetical protein
MSQSLTNIRRISLIQTIYNCFDHISIPSYVQAGVGIGNMFKILRVDGIKDLIN